MSARTLRALVPLAAAVLLAGCAAFEVDADQMPDGHDDHAGAGADPAHDHGDDAPPIDGAAEVEIVAEAMRFIPERIALTGDPVNLTLRSQDIFHDLVIDEAGFHIGADGDERATSGLEPLDPGTYVAYCSVPGHRSAGMELEVVVE